jgi:YidC/Oxa1 family membrane protein insertase
MDPVELVAQALTALAGVYGGSLGGALLTAGLAVRVALLPLTLHLAERAHRRAASIRALEPEVTALRSRHAGDPEALTLAVGALYRERGLPLADPRAVLGTLAQLPFVATAYAAVRRLAASGAPFRWIQDLSAPDLGVAAIVAAFSWASAAVSAPEGAAGRVLPLIVAAVMFVVASRVMAGLGLYLAASASVGLLQATLVRARTR